MSVLNENPLHGASGNQAKDYEIEYSCRFDETTSTALTRTPSSNGNSQVATFSAWMKYDVTYAVFWDVGVAGGGATQDAARFGFNSNGTIFFSEENNNSGRYSGTTTAIYRDPAAWYHVHFIINTPHATASERIKIYVNGVYQSGSYTYPGQNASLNMNLTSHNTRLGAGARTGGALYSEYTGLIAEAHWLDGQAIGPENFGETDENYGHWKPIEYEGGNYGTNGVYFKFDNASALGTDSSGNGNNYTLNNIGAEDQMIDTPTNSFCTLNPLDEGGDNTIAEGNLKYTKNNANFGPMGGTFGVTTGKWYFEIRCNATLCQVGISNNYNKHQSSGDNSVSSSGAIGFAWDSRGYYYQTGSSPSGYTSYSANDIVSVAFDADTGKVWIRKNGGSWENSGNPANGTNPSVTVSGYSELMPFVNGEAGGGLTANFGQDSSFAGGTTAQGNSDGNGKGDFYYTPPSGFLALCTNNLPAPTVKPKEHYNTVAYLSLIHI